MQPPIHMSRTGQLGFSLMEIVIAIVIFAIGMLALASLQGNLTRSAADAAHRTVAINIAEQIIESSRGFALLQTDPDGLLPAYADITDSTTSVTRGGINYDVTQTVTDYYYDLATDSFTTTPDGGISDFKILSVTVSWSAPEFRTTEGHTTEGSLGSGRIILAETLSSAPASTAARVVGLNSGQGGAIPIGYTPGQNPDVISIALGDNKFKESLLPEPRVIRADEIVETQFDVVTYGQQAGDSVFLRLEEFMAVSCECSLKVPPAEAGEGGRRPTIWVGDEYQDGHFVAKPYGVKTATVQSQFCDVCCRDHHDGGSHGDDHSDTALNVYNPFRAGSDYHTSGSFSGDHKHYKIAADGGLELASGDGDTYLEACRMVRKDGFWRVGHDFRQEDLHVFPRDFLDGSAEVATYSNYVTTAVDAFENASAQGYETAPPCIGGPAPCVAEPEYGGDYNTPLAEGQFPSWTDLPNGGRDDQQLRGRGIYIDYLSQDLRTVIGCLRSGGDVGSCQSGDVILDQTGSGNVFEIIPFFDVQMTYLHRWNETPTNTPVDTTNDPILTDNLHSRGLASIEALGGSTVDVTGHRGNLGFTDTQAIDPDFSAQVRTATLHVEATTEGSGTPTPPPPDGSPIVTGMMTENVDKVTLTDITVQGQGGAQCERTPSGFECTVPEGGSLDAKVKFQGYGRADINTYACFTGDFFLVLVDETTFGSGANATFSLRGDPQPNGPGYDINFRASPC